jgi:hypothetical protein
LIPERSVTISISSFLRIIGAATSAEFLTTTGFGASVTASAVALEGAAFALLVEVFTLVDVVFGVVDVDFVILLTSLLSV